MLQPITGEVLQVAKIVPHPSFETVTYGGDAALLFLRTATTAPAMVMADFALETAALDSGATDFAAGWGSTLPWSENAAGEIVSSPSYPNELMQTQLDLFTADACNGRVLPDPDLLVGLAPLRRPAADDDLQRRLWRAAPRAAEQGQWAQIGITSVGFLVGVGGATDYCKHYDGITRVAAVSEWAIATWKAYHATPAPAPKPRDVQKPILTLKSQKVAKRRPFRVYYRVRDNLGETADTLVVKLHGRVIVRKATAFGEAKNKLYFFRVGSKLRKGTYRLELRSRDRAGNVSKTAVAKLRVR